MFLKYFLIRGCDGSMRRLLRSKRMNKKAEYNHWSIIDTLCLNFSGCCFTKEKAPREPLHENCHCKVIEWPMIDPFAVCLMEKFTEYLFDKNKYKNAIQFRIN